MNVLVVLFLIIYILSPVPLLIFGLAERNRAKRLSEELSLLKKTTQIKIQPDIFADVPVVAVSGAQNDMNQNPDGTDKEAAPADGAQQPVVSVLPAPGDAARQPAVSVLPAPGDAAQQPVVPHPVTVQTLSRPHSPVVQPLSAAHRGYHSGLPADPAPIGSDRTPYVPKPVKITLPANTENNNMVIILVLGVVLLLLASVGFISATWSSLGIAARAVCLLSFSFILLAAGIFARAKLKLNNTSIAFYSIGSIALPITILGSAAFGLLGSFFTTETPNLYNTIILALCCLFVLLAFGAFYFESRVFAGGTLGSLSCIFFTLALRYNESPYRLNILLIALFASAAVLLVPYVKKIPDRSAFVPFTQVYESYSVLNIYVMSVVAIRLCYTSSVNRCTGIFLCILGAAFLVSSLRLKENGLLSLPSVILFLTGTGLLFRPTAFLPAILWMITAAACCIALSFVLKNTRVLSPVFYWIGVVFLILTPFPLFYYALVFKTGTPLPLLLTLPVIGGFLFLTKVRRQPNYAVGAILPAFTLFLGGALHIIALSVTIDTGDEFVDIFPGLPRTTVYLTALIIAAVLYAVFCYIPHHPLYTVFGEGILMALLVLWTYAYMRAFVFLKTYDEGIYTPGTAFLVVTALSFALLLLTLFNALRRDLLNVRDRSVTKLPSGILVLRIVYALIWPLFYGLGISVLSAPSGAVPDAMSKAVSGIILIAICFVCLIVLLKLCGPEGLFRPDLNEKLPASRVAVFFTAALTMIIEIIALCAAPDYTGSKSDILYILRHLLPLLIPAVLFFAYFRFRKIAPHVLPVLLLAGLYSFTVTFWYGMSIFRYFRIPDRTGIPEFFLCPEFPLSLIMLGFAVYYLVRADRAFSAGFVWMVSLSWLLFLVRFIDIDLWTNAVITISVGITLLSSALIFARRYYALSFVPIIMLAVLFIHYAVNLMSGYKNYSWLTVLICQIPVLLFSLFAYLLTVLRTDSYKRNPFPDYMLVIQCIIFYLTPFLTNDASGNEESLMILAGKSTPSGNMFNSIFETVLGYFTNCFFLAYALPGFLITAVCFFLVYRNDETVKKRVLGVSLVIASLLLCMRFPGAHSVAEWVGQFYLLPSAVFIAVLPLIIEDRADTADPNRTLIGTIRIVYCIGAMILLGFAALISGDSLDLFFYAVPAVGFLVLGYLFKKSYYFKLGIVCMAILVLYLINRIWGDMAWWIYLGLSGITLITVAVRNEIRKRSK